MKPTRLKTLWMALALLLATTAAAQNKIVRRTTTTTSSSTTTTTTTTTTPASPQKHEVKPPKATTGTLSITSTPSDAVVKIDGEYMGTTPLTLKNRKPGTYSITFSAEGYESATKSVTVSAGKTATCSATLRRKSSQPVQQQPARTTSSASTQTYTVNGVSFKMVSVEGGTFQMGSNDGGDDEKPVHSVTLSSYQIGQTEVTQELWQAVMGSNPSYYKGSNRPVEMVSWDDCKTFISKLNSLTGESFRLPTEAEWEFAARGGNKSQGYKHSGSNSLFSVAWYNKNSDNETHPVATLEPNELGIYDMCGNVTEFCQDWYGDYSSSSQTNPTGPKTGSECVLRGIDIHSNDYNHSTVGDRSSFSPTIYYSSVGFRLALQQPTTTSTSTQFDTAPSAQQQPAMNTSSASTQTYTVNGVSFNMVRVEGGTFQMGSNNGEDREKPVHSVTLSSYQIGQTEVTQELWQAVMGSNPSEFKGSNRPVEKVSWNDCKTFISKLNSLTGESFRLPTEAEWEFAARGGNKSQGYVYSGSNEIDDVAWYMDNETHPVATKAPNELGIYDMSGNVCEWCQDWLDYRYYSNSPANNPAGPSSGSHRVIRGGGWYDRATYCRVAYRYHDAPSGTGIDRGLRLAL